MDRPDRQREGALPCQTSRGRAPVRVSRLARGRSLLCLPWRVLHYLLHDTPLGRLLALSTLTGAALVLLALLLQALPLAGWLCGLLMAGVLLVGWLLRHPLVLLLALLANGR